MKPAEMTASMDDFAPPPAEPDPPPTAAPTADDPTGDEPPAVVEPNAVVIPQHTPRWWNRAWYRFEEFAGRLSTRNNFWHRICAWIWLPLAFRSGIKIQRGDIGTFSAVLPFRRFNKNWYNAMAGGALLANAEVAGGMYVFKKCGPNYTVVCRTLTYNFLRPCVGPAVYRIEPRENIHELLDSGGEFNITIDMNIVQMVQAKVHRERRVGTATAEFHVAPIELYRARKNWKNRKDK